MNAVNLIGRLTKDIELKYTAGGIAITRFSIAIDRPKKQGQEKQADFPRVVAFGKTAESCERYLEKGLKVGVSGRLQTSSYEDADGKSVWVTEVVADRVEFLEWAEPKQSGFAEIEEEVPW